MPCAVRMQSQGFAWLGLPSAHNPNPVPGTAEVIPLLLETVPSPKEFLDSTFGASILVTQTRVPVRARASSCTLGFALERP